MRLMYVKNNPKSGSPYCNIVGWCGWMIEFNHSSRILVQCDFPDNFMVGCMVKGCLEIDVDEQMLNVERSRLSHVVFTYGEVWSFLLEDFEMKPIVCAMLDMAFGESGVTEEEFKEYEKMYRSR